MKQKRFLLKAVADYSEGPYRWSKFNKLSLDPLPSFTPGPAGSSLRPQTFCVRQINLEVEVQFVLLDADNKKKKRKVKQFESKDKVTDMIVTQYYYYI